ncbi:MAG: DNA mismatch repair protein MutS [Acholeplasmataceae bacterium]
MKKEKYTPMMMQYLNIKEQYPDTLILFRLGDFYELFFDDAKIASKELELVLTGKNAGASEKVPMCGVPYHAITSYIERLIKRGYKVGIVEQLEDPALAKGLVSRDVVQMITPGMLIDVGLQEKDNNYLLALLDNGVFYSLAYCDISTGELGVLNVERNTQDLINEITTFGSHEIVVSPAFDASILNSIVTRDGLVISRHHDVEVSLDYVNLLTNIKDGYQQKVLAFLIDYLVNTQKRQLDYLKQAVVLQTNQYLKMDAFTRNNLELTRTVRSEDRYGSLLWVIDKTKTAMGARLLKSYLTRPLANLQTIEKRQQAVTSFINNFMNREVIIKQLDEVYDLPRLIAKISYGNANGRDLIQLSKSLQVVPEIKQQLNSIPELQYLGNKLNPLTEIVTLIGKAIVNDPPISVKEGGLIKKGYNKELDEIKDLSKGGKEWIANFEKEEKERTGIKGLKIGYNKVFGFYIDITNSYLNLVKPEFGYIRKQTLTGSERFITQELKEKEDQVINAEEKMIRLEYELFLNIRNEVKKVTTAIQQDADVLAEVDVLCSFASVSVANHYVKPTLQEKKVINIVEGRHPVIEKVLQEHEYVPNDVKMDEKNFLQLITGPNMGGKSTYMRQVASIVVLAQVGCYVPATSATLSVFDAIYTRIGASDDLVSGQSTFMVEMLEVNNALVNATPKSLIVFDEIGRGTSTFDGMALAQAIIEYISVNIQAITLFSTHYHELVNMASSLPGVTNVSAQVHEENDNVTFLYKIKEGATDRSYGINVARLAHIPDSVLNRAQEILHKLESQDKVINGIQYVVKEVTKESQVEAKLQTLDPLNLTPLEALNILAELKKECKKHE